MVVVVDVVVVVVVVVDVDVVDVVDVVVVVVVDVVVVVVAVVDVVVDVVLALCWTAPVFSHLLRRFLRDDSLRSLFVCSVQSEVLLVTRNIANCKDVGKLRWRPVGVAR